MLGRWLLILAVLGWSQPARADRARARAYLDEGLALAARGEDASALLQYERAIRSDVDYIPAYEAAVPLWLSLGHWQTARSNLESVTLRCPDCVFAWYALGALYRKLGRFDLAILAYEAYLAKRPDDGDALFGLAMASHAARDERAASKLQRYLRVEVREEREPFRAKARSVLAELRAPLEPVIGANSEAVEPEVQSEIANLLREGRVASAESLVNASGHADRGALRWRIAIALARGQWFQALGYRGLRYIYSLGSAPAPQTMSVPERP